MSFKQDHLDRDEIGEMRLMTDLCAGGPKGCPFGLGC
jgi:hypothetical protein